MHRVDIVTSPDSNARSQRGLKEVWKNWGPLLASLASAVLFLVLFAWLADGVFEGAFGGLDLRSRMFVHGLASPSLTAAMQAVTFLGSAVFLSILFLVLIAVFLFLKLRHHAAWLATSMAGAVLLEITLKLVFQRTRPEAFFGRDPTGYSFPSGHALGSFCFYGILAGLFSSHIKARSARILLWMAAAALVLAIGFSRIYLGVHYPTDVIAGYLAASVWVSTLLFVADIRRSAKQRRQEKRER